MDKKCPCFSGKLYKECCHKYHSGAIPENALSLMRSRYSAYSLGLAQYIMDTTHPKNPSFSYKRDAWEKEILAFAHSVQFVGLEILEFADGEEESFVTFKALLKRGKEDVSFIEKSRFTKIKGRWLYRDGVLTSCQGTN